MKNQVNIAVQINFFEVVKRCFCCRERKLIQIFILFTKQLILDHIILEMFYQNRRKENKELFSKQDIQISNNTLQRVVSLLNLLTTCHDPATIYEKFWFYQKANQQGLKEEFRLKIQSVHARMNRKQSIINTVKQLNKKQKLVNDLTIGKPFTPIKLDIKTEEILKKIGKIKRKEEQTTFQAWEVDPLFKDMVIQFNRTKIKYDIIMNSIISYKKNTNPHFIYYMGDWMDDFDAQERQNITEFDNELNQGWRMKIKEAFTSKKPQNEIILNTLNEMEDAKDFTELNKIIYKNKFEAQNYKIFEKFIKNSKIKIKLQTALKSLKLIMNESIETAQEILTQIQSDIDFDSLTKSHLKQVSHRLLEIRKCESLFSSFGISFDYKSILSFTDYYNQQTKFVKSILQELQTHQQTKILYVANENNLFLSMAYLTKLVEYIKSQSNTDSTEASSVSNSWKLQQNGQRETIEKAIEQKNELCRQLSKQLSAQKYKNSLLEGRIYKLNEEIKKLIGGSVEIQFSQQEQIDNIEKYELLERQKQELQKKYVKQIQELKQKIRAFQSEQKQKIIELVVQNQLNKGQQSWQHHHHIRTIQGKERTRQILTEDKSSQVFQNKENQKRFQNQISDLKNKLESKQEIIKLKQHQQNELENKLSSVLAQNQEKEEQIRRLCKLKDIQSAELNQKMTKLQQNLDKVTSQRVSLEKRIMQSQLQLTSAKELASKQRSQYQNTNKQMKTALQIIQNKFSQSKQQNSVLNNKVEELLKFKTEVEGLQFQISNLSKISYFNGQTFEDQEENLHPLKQTLIQNIQSHWCKRLKRTRLIYKLDSLNQTQPHTYIDKKQNWVALFKLPNNYIIGALSSESYQSGGLTKSGFMFNLNTKKFYKLLAKEKSKMYQYQDFYFIIGNSQIRYRFSQRTVENEFGSIYKYFDTAKDTPLMFFGTQENKIVVKTFEFYQLMFEQ